jgi:hypothetical protein
MPEVSRREIVAERVAALERNFARYVAAYDDSVPFSTDQYEAHAATILLRRSLGSAASAVEDDAFIMQLRKTLIAWRLGVRGSRLAAEEQFAEALRGRSAELARLDGLAIDDQNLDVEAVAHNLWDLIASLGIVDNKAKLVAGSKALHHVLPDLVVPMDRQWTGLFFGLHPPEWQDPDNQRRIFRRGFESFAAIARGVDPGRFVGGGWRTSRTKVLDNALIGFCKLELLSETQRVALPGTREFRFEVAGFPPAKNEALSMVGAGHSHAPRVVSLLTAVRDALEVERFNGFGSVPIWLDVVIYSPPGQDPWDATNYLGGIADVLEDKARRGALEHLADLAAVSLYANDRQIKQVSYRQEDASEARYVVRIRELEP